MVVSPLDRTTDEGLRCPACNAKQAWSDTCRRCKCDLTLLASAREACNQRRRRCLLHLRAGRLPEAFRQARRCYAMCPDERSARLLAICHLLCRNWTGAIAASRLAGEEP